MEQIIINFDLFGANYHQFKPFWSKIFSILTILEQIIPNGNGRIARVMMNAELSSKGLSKIIIPTVYREDYMGALKKLTKQRDADAYIRMMLRSWEFSSYIHDDSLDEMERYLIACNAFLSHKEGYLKIIPH